VKTFNEAPDASQRGCLSAGRISGSPVHATRQTPYADLPEWLTVEETRAFLGLGRNTAYELIKCGDLPSRRFGKTIRVPKTALFGVVDTLRER
jgi:excisionase family DNA binding protein